MQTPSKLLLRLQARQKRAALPAARRARAAAALPAFLPDLTAFCARFCRLPAARLQSFALYYPLKQELDTRPLIRALLAQNKKILLPALGKQAKPDAADMVFRVFSPGEELQRGAFGIYQPAPRSAEALPAAEIPQALLLPLLAFDARGGRLGYGGGYYDKAVAALRRQGYNPPLIGLGFAAQELPLIPAEPHDIALHAILTEQGLRVF